MVAGIAGDGSPVRSATFAAIDWERWRPRERATLLFVVEAERILLIRKKRGLGAGKITGPGGGIEVGETPEECAIREVGEELCIEPLGVRRGGELSFQFVDGLALHVVVFIASGRRGEPQETVEALPLWAPVTAIPYGEMWADDSTWLPHLLAGRPFHGRFLFDGDRMLGQELQLPEDA